MSRAAVVPRCLPSATPLTPALYDAFEDSKSRQNDSSYGEIVESMVRTHLFTGEEDDECAASDKACPPSPESLLFQYDMEDPLVKPDLDRFVLFPIKEPEMWATYKAATKHFWIVEDIDMSQDRLDWNDIIQYGNEYKFVSYNLAFFLVWTWVVVTELPRRFSGEIQCAEARSFYGFQSAMLHIHIEFYSKLLSVLINNPEEHNGLYFLMEHSQTIVAKGEWCFSHIDDLRLSFAIRILVGAIAQSIFTASAFASIFYFQLGGMMPGFCQAISMICRDGRTHTDFAALVFSRLVDKPHPDFVQDRISEAVTLEKQVVADGCIKPQWIGIDIDSMMLYIEFVADDLLVKLGQDKLYNTKNPFPFTEHLFQASAWSVYAGNSRRDFRVNINDAISTTEEF